ncbi:hypothetical protein J1614_011037 [Plenodomus biglobosus]|nr:hypothetical protein J1614_011037 [Plenodomus biglobosus]
MEFFKRIRQSLRKFLIFPFPMSKLIVGLLHLVTLGTRLWGLLWGRPGRSEGVDGGKGNGTGNRSGDDKGWDVAPRDVDVKLRGARLSVGLSMVSQGESGLKRRRRGSKADSSDEQNNNKKNESGDYGSKAEAAWHEALLECLVP